MQGKGKERIPHHPHFTSELTKHLGGCVVLLALFLLFDDEFLNGNHLIVIFALVQH
jgi:hypothetical protein